MDDGRDPDPDGRDPYVGPPPPAERRWRHPSELGGGAPTAGTAATADTIDTIDGPPPLHRGVVVGTAVATLLLVVGITRLLVPGAVDEIAVVTLPAPRLATFAPDTTAHMTPDVSAPVAPDVSMAVDVALVTAAPDTAPGLAVAVQEGALYVTTGSTVGDGSSVLLTVDGRDLSGRVLLVDERNDVALVHVMSSDIDPNAIDDFSGVAATAALGDAVRVLFAAAEPGDGSTLEFLGAVLDGSAGQRSGLVVDADDRTGTDVDGAPVVDLDGHLVGLCRGGAEADHLVPVDELVNVAASAVGVSPRVDLLGVTGVDTTDGSSGVRVTAVDGVPSDTAAGIAVGDVIVGFAHPASATARRTVHSLADLAIDLADRSAGDVVTIVVSRDGVVIDVPVTLGEAASGPAAD